MPVRLWLSCEEQKDREFGGGGLSFTGTLVAFEQNSHLVEHDSDW